MLKDQPILARPGLALIAIAEHILRLGRLFRHERPLHPRRESRPAAPSKPGILYFINNGVRLHAQRLLHGLIAVQVEIAVNIRRALPKPSRDDLYLIGM